MRKTFQLNLDGKHPDRLMDAIKHEVAKYVKRERQKDLPTGADFWDFDCRFGLTPEQAQVVHLAQIKGLFDRSKADGDPQCYVEVIAKPGVRTAKPEGAQHVIATAPVLESD